MIDVLKILHKRFGGERVQSQWREKVRSSLEVNGDRKGEESSEETYGEIPSHVLQSLC